MATEQFIQIVCLLLCCTRNSHVCENDTIYATHFEFLKRQHTINLYMQGKAHLNWYTFYLWTTSDEQWKLFFCQKCYSINANLQINKMFRMWFESVALIYLNFVALPEQSTSFFYSNVYFLFSIVVWIISSIGYHCENQPIFGRFIYCGWLLWRLVICSWIDPFELLTTILHVEMKLWGKIGKL